MVTQCMKLMLSVIMCFSLILTIPTVSCISNPPVVYVSGENSGDFNCNATNAGSQINQAFQFIANNPEYTTVYLKGPFTYMTNDTLLIGSNTILTGDPGATLKLEDYANWPVSKPIVSANSSTHDIGIYGFTIDGNRNNNINVKSGQGYYNIFSFSNSQNIDIHDMCLTNNHGDGLYTNRCTNIKFYNNRVYLLGHDGIYICYSNFIESYNNSIICRTNSGLRIYNSNHVSFHDNTITAQGSGGAGIEIQKEGTRYVMNDIEIYNNIIHDTLYAGIWIFGSGSYLPADTYVHVFNNCIYNTGINRSSSLIGGILSDGFNGLIEKNTITATYGSGISQANIYSHPPQGSGFTLTLKNNSISNTRRGYGINNALPGTHSFVLESNYFDNNSPGDYYETPPIPLIMPTASFYSDINNGYSPLVVQFVDTSGNATSWAWNFGDNSAISTERNPVHTFTNDGVYTVILTASNINGTSSTSAQIIVTSKPIAPVASFGTSSTTGIEPLSVTFTDKSTGSPTAWSWNFGDNSAISSERNPVHTFTNAGVYTVILTTSNINSTSSASAQIVVSPKPVIPVASFSTSSTTGVVPLSVTFTDNSTGSPTTWSWNFGDNGAISSQQNTIHTFAAVGVYTVTHTASNINGTSSTSTQIVVSPKPVIPIASFNASTTTGTTTSPITFTDTSTNVPTSWSWNFGDGTSATTQNAYHVFTKAGKYTVSLTVKNVAGSAKAIKTVTVSKPKVPVASFKVSTTTGTTTNPITFTDTSTNVPTSWSWNFGDGTSATTQNASHVFTKAGKYTVSLTVKNVAGSAKAIKTVTVSTLKTPVTSAPVASFSASTTAGRAPLTVTFTDKSTNKPSSWYWDFGDGSTSTIQKPVHKYTKKGNYTVSLIVKNAGGNNSLTKPRYITVK